MVEARHKTEFEKTLNTLHDSTIVGIESEGERIMLALSDKRQLSIRGVRYFMASPFMMGNIIDSFTLISTSDFSEETASISINLARVFLDFYGPYIKGENQKNHLMLQMTSSYGCEIIALLQPSAVISIIDNNYC